MSLEIIVSGDNCWPDLVDEAETIMGTVVGVARLPGGMKSGASSVTFRIYMPDGRTILAQMSLDMLNSATLAFNAVEEQ